MGASVFKYSGQMVHWTEKPKKRPIKQAVKVDPASLPKVEPDDFWKRNFQEKVIKTAKR